MKINKAINLYIFFSILLLFTTTVKPVIAKNSHNNLEYFFFDEHPISTISRWKTMVGDSIHWKDICYDDSNWNLSCSNGLWISNGYKGQGIHWYRKTLFFPEATVLHSPLAIYLPASLSACEIYWDGILIAKNGVVGHDSLSEIPGHSGQIYPIPINLTIAGKHVITIRISNYHEFSGLLEPNITIGYFHSLYKKLTKTQAISLFLAGIFFITAMFHIVLLFGEKNKIPYGIFSLFSLSCFTYILTISFLKYFQLDLTYYYTLAVINDIPWFLMITLLPVFFLFEFFVPKRIILSLSIATLNLIIVALPRLATIGVINPQLLDILDLTNRAYAIFTILFSISIAIWAMKKNIAGSATALIGLLMFLVGAYFTYQSKIPNGWALGFSFLIGVMTISLSRQMAHRNKMHREAKIKSARLELELLKKHIQPHFLLNSLNSIVAWLEEEPTTASKLVNALAFELRMLLDSSGRKIIPLKDEIDLCKAHLSVMNLRLERQYELKIIGEIANESIPPLILHTLIENGLTHGYKGREKGCFVLTCKSLNDILKITVFNDGLVDSNSEIQDGTGLRYIKSRLQDAFPNHWDLSSCAVDGGWQVEIKIKREKK